MLAQKQLSSEIAREAPTDRGRKDKGLLKEDNSVATMGEGKNI